jgi:hypothetical protein
LRTCCKQESIFTLLRTCSCIVVKIYSISFFYHIYHSQLSNHFAKSKGPWLCRGPEPALVRKRFLIRNDPCHPFQQLRLSFLNRVVEGSYIYPWRVPPMTLSVNAYDSISYNDNSHFLYAVECFRPITLMVNGNSLPFASQNTDSLITIVINILDFQCWNKKSARVKFMTQGRSHIRLNCRRVFLFVCLFVSFFLSCCLLVWNQLSRTKGLCTTSDSCWLSRFLRVRHFWIYPFNFPYFERKEVTKLSEPLFLGVYARARLLLSVCVLQPNFFFLLLRNWQFLYQRGVIITPLVSTPTIRFKFSAPGNKNMADAQTSEVGATLALFSGYLESWNCVC